MIFFVSLLGFLCIGTVAYRAYVPVMEKFRFVESYAYEEQKINPSNLSYFLTFNFIELFQEGQSFVFGNKNVARTLPTFLYGSSLFGEYDFTNIIATYPIIKILMQLIILTGLLLPLGIIANLFYIKKWNVIDYICAFGISISLILIISFLCQYPSVCNSDFRYFSPIFLGVLIMSGLGISRLNEKSKIKFVLPILSFILLSSELCWLIARIAAKILINI
jgi:hypothetical protein